MADRSVEVRLRADVSQFQREMAAAAATTKATAKEMDGTRVQTTQASKEIDRMSGRLRLFADAAATVGPALLPIGAVAVPAVAALSVELGAAALAAGTAVLAFKGIGDGLKALDTYQLEPTAENFQKLQIAMEDLGPAGAEFVRFLDSVAPKFADLQMTAREGMFPGVEEGINNLLTLLPQVNRIVEDVSSAMGQLAAEAGAGLSGAGFTAFFKYLETDARPILVELGRTIGNFAEGLGHLVVDFAPTTAAFSGGLLEMSQAFEKWSDGLQDNQGFQDFLSYIQDAAPMVLDFVGSLVGALTQIVEAAAPVGSAVLPILTSLLHVIGDIADSPAGTALFTAAAGFAAYTRAASLAAAANERFAISSGKTVGPLNTSVAALRGGGAIIGMIALSMTDLDEKAGVSNTAMLTLMGTMLAPGWGTAAGFITGAILDIGAANDDLQSAMDRASRAFDSNNIEEQKASLKGLKEQLEETRKAADISDALKGGRFQGEALFNAAKAGLLQVTGAADKASAALADFQARAAGRAALKSLLVGPLNLTAAAFEAAGESAKDFAHAVEMAFGLLDKRASLRDARQAIRDFNAELKDSPKHLKQGTKAYDDMEAALDGIARSSLDAAKKLRGATKTDFLDKQRDSFIKAARDMGYTRKAAENLADDLHLLDKTKADPKVTADTGKATGDVKAFRNLMDMAANDHASPDITVDTHGAAGIISGIAGALSNLNGNTATTYINTIHRSINQVIPGVLGGGGADGMTVPGPRHPYGDKMLILAAPGEEVISNRHGQADQFRADRSAGRIPGYAGGGYVSDGYWMSGRGRGHHGHDEAGDAAHSLAKRLKEAQKELEKETAKRRDLISDMKSYRSEVSQSLSHDPFNQGGLEGFQLQLEADRNDALAMRRALKQAQKHGLSGGLFAALAASGDLTTAQQFAGLSRSQIRQQERLFSQTHAAQASLGQFAANEKFGDAVHGVNKELKHLRDELKHLHQELKHQGKHVENGARAGIRDRDRSTAARGRTGR